MTMTVRARLAAGTLALVIVAALFAGLSPYGATQVRTAAGVETLRAPSSHHWLGTDAAGRDVATRLVFGARTSLTIAAGALALALGAGILFGALAAARKDRAADALVTGACDLVSAIPALLLVVAAQGLTRHSSFAFTIFLIAIPSAAYVTRVARAELARALAAPHVEAARAAGASLPRLLTRHALPLAAPQLAVAAAMTLSSAVLSEAALTFLSFGTPPPTASWGELLREAHEHGLAWWLALPAGAAVALVTIAANALADDLALTSRTSARASGRTSSGSPEGRSSSR
jgi:peptide/nickel transport system permease protein